MGEVPVADAAGRALQAERERALLHRAVAQRQRFVERVAESGIDVPRAVG